MRIASPRARQIRWAALTSAVIALAAFLPSALAQTLRLQPLSSFGTNGDGSLRPGQRPYMTADGNGYQRGLAYNPRTGHLLVVDRHSAGAESINILDGTTGADVGQLDTSSLVLGGGSSYYITPTRIPTDMYYKPPSIGGSPMWYTYGNPGYDKTDGRGDWTYIVWSCVQQGNGLAYPDNITHGGGLVRALGKRDAIFHRCDVPPIVGISYGPGDVQNGVVTSIYGGTQTDANGSWIYGWLVYSYQKTGQPLVPCVRRCSVTTARTTRNAAAAQSSGTNRMSGNLLQSELSLAPAEAARLRSEWLKRFAAESRATARMEILTEMPQLDDALTVRAMLDLLQSEGDSGVRQQIVLLLGFMRMTRLELKKVSQSLLVAYEKSGELGEWKSENRKPKTEGNPKAEIRTRNTQQDPAAGAVAQTHASDASSLWNVDGQARTHTCTPLQSATATLRFPDGTPTGFYAYADDPSRNGSAPDCALGYVEIDAQEILTNGAGWELCFHPGGGPDLYNDYVNKGQYGHIRVTDLAARPVLAPKNLNGKVCSLMPPETDDGFAVNLIGVADDGAIYAGNLTTGTLGPPEFRLYRWANETSPQALVYAGDPSNLSTNISNWRWGDALTVRGAGTNTQVLITSHGGLAAILSPADASMTAFTVRTLTTDVAAEGFSVGLAFGAGTTFWTTGGGGLRQVAFDVNGGTTSTLRIFDASAFPGAVAPITLLIEKNLLAGIEMLSGPDLVRLYDVSNATRAPGLLDRRLWVTNLVANTPAGALTFDATNRLYALASDNGLMAFALLSVSTNSLAPVFYLQPADIDVCAGSNVVFSAAADGSAPLRYQWQFNNKDIPEATSSSLRIPNAQSTNAGTYNVVVTNGCGTTTSSVARLSVVAVIPNPPGLVVYEPFAYGANTLLAGQGGWLLNSGTSGAVQAGNLSVPALAPSLSNHFGWSSASMSLRLPIGTNTSGSLYFSFALRVGSLGTGASDTLAGFTTGTSTSFAPKLNLASNSFGAYNLGLYKSSGLTTGGLATNVFTTNDVVFLVARYTFNTNSATDDTCDLWLSPAPSTFAEIFRGQII